MKFKSKAYNQIAKYLKTHPDASNHEIAVDLHLLGNKQAIYYVRHQLKKQLSSSPFKKPKPETKEKKKFQLSVCIPDDGVEVKLNNYKYMIGTFEFVKDGWSFRRAKAKKKPTAIIPWEKLEKLMDLL